jgi:phosphonate transport system permease protein
MSGGLHNAFLSQRAGIVERHAHHLRPIWREQVAPGLIAAAMFILFIFGLWQLGFSAEKFIHGGDQLWVILAVMLPPDPHSWSRTLLYLNAMVETVGIAFLGTLGAALFALPFGFLAAKNVMPNWLVHILSRRLFDTMRGVDILIWALIWINVVGLGPFAGVMAMMCADFGAFAKLFSEAIETASRGTVEGVIAAGGSEVMAVRFGIVPQVLPVILSQMLYYFESNTRSATIIGIVGAGGIGLHLSEMIRTVEWQQVSFIIVLMLIAVSAIDWLSTKLRLAIIGSRPV